MFIHCNRLWLYLAINLKINNKIQSESAYNSLKQCHLITVSLLWNKRKICIYSRLRLNLITVFSTSTHFGIFHQVQLVRMCRIAWKTSTLNKLLKWQKKKGDQTNLKEGVFRHWNGFFIRKDLCSNVMFCLVWFVQKIQGRD